MMIIFFLFIVLFEVIDLLFKFVYSRIFCFDDVHQFRDASVCARVFYFVKRLAQKCLRLPHFNNGFGLRVLMRC